MSFHTGQPTWTWPEWRKAPRGTRIRHNGSGRYGTYIQPAKSRHNGAIVRWDAKSRQEAGVDGQGGSYVIAPARDLTPVRFTAWDLIGSDGNRDTVYGELQDAFPATFSVRLVSGRALYEAVTYYDNTPGERVKLSRLEPRADGIRQVNRWVDPDAKLEIVETL